LVASRIADQVIERLAHQAGQPAQVSDGDQPDAVVHDLGALADDVLA